MRHEPGIQRTDKTEKPQATMVSMEQHYSGPLPPAQEFRAYGEVMKDAPERIVGMAETEQKHRHKGEDFEMKVRFVDNIIGMVFGMAVVCACLWLAYVLGIKGHDWLAGVIVTIAASFAAIFVLRKMPKNED